MKATVFGAGNIGRGLVGLVLWQAGYDVTYVDADVAHVARLNDSGEFAVVPPSGETTVVPVYKALVADDLKSVVAAVAESAVIATAVGKRILKFVAEPISQGLARSRVPHVNVLACENAHPNSPLLRWHVAEYGSIRSGVGFPEVIVDRIVSSESGDLDLRVESTFEFLVDADKWEGPMPVGGPNGVSPIDAYIVRKLWLVNGLHFAAAVLGMSAGHEFIHDAMADETVSGQISTLANLMIATLEVTYPDFPLGEFAAVTAASLDRFANPEMQDPVVRVARNPLAKLQGRERVLAPAIAALKLGLNGEAYAPVIASALQLSDSHIDGVAELIDKVAAAGPVGLLNELGSPQALTATVERILNTTN
jgi:mannitol-1-phosphate 5-dehydrogenase